MKKRGDEVLLFVSPLFFRQPRDEKRLMCQTTESVHFLNKRVINRGILRRKIHHFGTKHAQILLLHHSMSSPSSAKLVRVSSWNVAAINDNPFEYYVTIDSKKSDVNDDDISDENGNDDDVDALRRRRIEGRRNQKKIRKNDGKDRREVDQSARARGQSERYSLERDVARREERIMNMKIDDSWTELECDVAMGFFEKHLARGKF